MRLVPLYDETAPIHSSHNVRAPGGYEMWRIVAYDLKQELLFYAAVQEGCQTDPHYINAYRQYRRDPTNHAPPVPTDYRWEELAVYHRDRRLAHSLTRINPPSVPISGAGQLYAGRCVLNFDSKPPQSSFDASTFDSSHHWLFSSPLASLRGQLALQSAQFDFDDIPVCRDHRYGPALPKIARLMEGVAFLPDSAIFFLATSTTSWMIRAGRDGIHLMDEPLTIEVSNTRIRSRIDISPEIIHLGDGVTLSGGWVIDRFSARSRIFFAPSPNGSIHGFCEIWNPRRITWPVEKILARRPQEAQPILTLSPLPPTDKSSPSPPEHARAPSSSP